MTRARKAGLAVLLLAILYPLAAWFLGMQVESALGKQYDKLAEQGLVSVVSRDYQRGIFSASETLTLAFSPALSRALSHDPGAAAAAPVRMVIRSRILHGPLPGARSIGAALAYSELHLDDASRARIADVIKIQGPLTGRVRFGFFGSSNAHMAIPAFTLSMHDKTQRPLRISGDAATLDSDFSADRSRYAVDLDLPQAEMQAADARIHLNGLRYRTDAKRVFEEGSRLYATAAQLTLDTFEVGPPNGAGKIVSIQKIDYRSDMPRDGDYLDVIVKFAAAGFEMGGQNYGPVYYDFALQHLQARALDALSRGSEHFSRLAMLGQAASAPANMLAPFQEPLRNLLANQPSFRIERLQFRGPQGEALLTAELHFKDARTEDFANPGALLGKLDLKADVTAPEAMLAGMLQGHAAAANDPQQPATPQSMAAQQLAMLAQQGYIERGGGLVKTHVAFTGGKLTLNGKPFGPAMAH